MERAIAIVVLDSDGLAWGRAAEIAGRRGLRVGTAHRIVRALVRGGLLAQDPRTERYHLGPRLALLGQSAMARYGLDVVRPQLEDLARITGEAASLGVHDGDDVVVILRAESTQPLRFDRPHGSRVPLPPCQPWARRSWPSRGPSPRPPSQPRRAVAVTPGPWSDGRTWSPTS